MKVRSVVVLVLLCIAPDAVAQRSSYQMMQDTNRMLMNRVDGKAATQKPASPAVTRFTPVAGDDSVKQLADSLGNTPEERQQILQLASAGKDIFALKYKGNLKERENTLAGAMAFFVTAAYIVQTGQQPSAAAEEQLFASLNATLASSDIVQASDAEKTALYNVLLASAGMPLVIYTEGSRSGNAGLVEQARTMIDGLGRKLFNMELEQIVGMLGAGGGGNPGPAARSQ